MNGALYLDKVIVETSSFNGRFYRGKIEKIVKRNKEKYICIVDIDENNKKMLKPYMNSHNLNIKLNEKEEKSISKGDILEISINSIVDNKYYNGKIISNIGNRHDNNIELKVFANENNFNLDFNNKTIKEIEKLKVENQNLYKNNLIDLKDKHFIAISTNDSFENAIYIENLNNGNYVIYVSITCVNKYIKTNSEIFKDAIKRSISRTTPFGFVPLFPNFISNELCSLNKGEEKIVKTCEIEINSNGFIKNYNIYDSVIMVKDNLIYDKIENNIENLSDKTSEQLDLAQKVSSLYMKQDTLAALKNSQPNIESIMDENREISHFENSNNKFKIIINMLMSLANETIATEYSWLPFIYKNYNDTELNQVKYILSVLKNAGFNINVINNLNINSLEGILKNIGDSKRDKIAKKLIMDAINIDKKKLNNKNTFSIGIDENCNFTSPLNRITDFILHTIIDEINELDYSELGMKELEENLIELCKNVIKAKDQEIKAQELIKNKKILEYMSEHINEKYNAYIIEINDSSIIIETDDLIIGEIKIDKIQSDMFGYEYSTKSIIGRFTKENYKIGDRVYVISREISKKDQKVYFELLGKQKSLSKNNKLL